MRRLALIVVLMLIVAGCETPEPEPSSPSGEWVDSASGSDASLRGLCVVDAVVAWASGAAGTYLRTTDGGQSWSAGIVTGAEELDFRDVHAWSAERAVLLSAGRPGRIYETQDGGETWLLRYDNDTEGVFFNALSFWDESRGIAVGDPIDGRFLIIVTEDGGETWTEVPSENRPEALLGEAHFAASGTCLFVTESGRSWFGTGGPAARVFRSIDWGRIWQVAQTPVRSGQASQGVFSLFFWDDNNGIAVGGDYLDEPNPEANAAHTVDGGKTWKSTDVPPTGFRECVVPTGGNRPGTLVTVGPSGTDFSFDFGKTWTAMGSGSFHAVGFSSDGSTGIAVGAEGRVARWIWH
jgi:photosystem II stability/assembly factor-like uncharacterized protein